MGTSARPSPAPAYVTPTAPPWSVLALLPRAFWPWIKNYKAYATSFTPLALSAAATNNIALNAGAFFVMLSATMVETDTGNAAAFGYRPLTVQIYDSNAGINLFSQAVGADEIFGDAGTPGLFAFPYIWAPSNAIQVTLTNLEAVARNVRLTFHGFAAIPNSNEDTGEQYTGMGGR